MPTYLELREMALRTIKPKEQKPPKYGEQAELTRIVEIRTAVKSDPLKKKRKLGVKAQQKLTNGLVI